VKAKGQPTPIGIDLHHADWLDAVATLAPGSIDLLYADLPFATGSTKRTPPNAKRAGRTVNASYADTFAGSDGFIGWLRPRLLATLPALRPTACILLHLDWRTCHHARLLLDDLLGPACFVNHLIWSYGLGGSSPRRFARKHDDILFYARTPGKHYFDPPRVPTTSNLLRGKSKKMTDVLAIASINNMARERTGYPTQKPLALLDVLVRACSPTGGTVLDPCCGSGTTLVAATLAGRKGIGIDRSAQAIAVARKRIREARPASTTGVPKRGKQPGRA